MTISEPMTLVTDYVLGTLAEVCAVLLMKDNRALKQHCVRLWASALMGTALASYLGGTYHGFQHMLGVPVAAALWTATTLAMGVASFFLLAAALTAAFSGQERRWLIGAAALKFVIYATWMLGHDEFRFVIYDYGSTLAILLLLLMSGRTTGLSGHRLYITSGILVSIAAALAQQTGVRLHRYFNHNDLMHVIQMAGVWLLYRGGTRLRDAGGTRGSQP